MFLVRWHSGSAQKRIRLERFVLVVSQQISEDVPKE